MSDHTTGLMKSLIYSFATYQQYSRSFDPEDSRTGVEVIVLPLIFIRYT